MFVQFNKVSGNIPSYGRHRRAFLAAVAVSLIASTVPAAAQQRVLGLDVSAWQGNISQSTWNNIHNVEDRAFVFIRSSRGGTTGFYNQSDPNNNNNQNTLSQRYDDPYFVQNITRATNAGMFAGSYHFSRPDVIETTQNSGGIANTGADEADHFIQMAGAWMRPGYLLPVHDLEAGDGDRTDDEMAQFAIDFSDRVLEMMGIRPAVYVNGNYANFVVGGASASLQDETVAAYPTLWSARWPNQSDPDSIDVQNEHPGTSISWVYGPWDDPPQPTHPWSFWQYASTGRLQSYNNGNSNLDFNVAQGGIEFVKDQLVPALWMNDSSGEWTTLANWNSGQTPVAPMQGPGQVPRVGTLTLPTERLPANNDTVILDRPNVDITVTLSTGAHQIRKLEVREELVITGSSLTVNYVPTTDSTPTSARFSAPVTLDGAHLSVHTLQIDATQTFSLGGALEFNTVQLMPHPTSPATINVIGDVNVVPLANATARIVTGAGSGGSGEVDLGGANRTWNIIDGGAVIDLAIDVPVVDGALTKTGAGTLALEHATSYDGDTSVDEGTLSLANGVLADTASVHLSSGATLNLDFSGSPDVIDELYIDGVSQAVGTWGGLGSGAQFTTPFITGAGLLQVSTQVSVLPGDYNFDGTVNAADYTVWRNNLGASITLPGDTTPGTVTAADYNVWKTNFGMTAPASLASSPVPEPSSFLLLFVGLTFVYGISSRK